MTRHMVVYRLLVNMTWPPANPPGFQAATSLPMQPVVQLQPSSTEYNFSHSGAPESSVAQEIRSTLPTMSRQALSTSCTTYQGHDNAGQAVLAASSR
jgi:hypothetical protein